MMTEARRQSIRKSHAKRQAGLHTLMQVAREEPCVDCGLREPAIVQFDHVPERGAKRGNIAGMTWRSRGQFLREMAKCDPVCPNCHVRRTNARQA